MGDDLFGIVGTTQGPFTVERVVAEGGFGVVYRAYHGAFRAPVALKCLKIPGEIPVKLQDRFLEQFREEAEMLFRLSAAIPAVVRPLHHDVILSPSGHFVPFIALEWLDGETLDTFLDRRTSRREPPLPAAEAAALLAPIARALEAAHRFPGPSGPICVVHRDLKPANIYLADVHGTQVVKILDFGIARTLDAASVIAGQTSTTGGVALAFTPRYGAPEQWAPKRFGRTGPWTDVWGLALTYMEMLIGRPVLDGDPMAMMGTALDEKRRPTPRSEGVKVPDALEAVFRKALAVDPRDRFPDVGTFWDEVELALGLEPSFAPIARPGRPGAPPARPSAPRVVASPSAATVAAPISDSLEIDLPVAGAAGQATVAAPERGAGAGGARAAAASPAPPAARSVRPAPPGKASPESPRAAKGSQERARPTPKPPAAFEFDFGHELPPAKAPAPPALDMGAEAGRPRVKPLAAAPSSVAPPARREGASLAPPEAKSGAASELSELFGLPLRLAGAGVLLSLLDQAVASLLLGGERIGIGPLKLLWVAAGLVVVAIGIALARVLGGVR